MAPPTLVTKLWLEKHFFIFLTYLFKWWYHLHYRQNNSKRQFEQSKFNADLEISLISFISHILLEYTINAITKDMMVYLVAP